jgi:hypothetical protein
MRGALATDMDEGRERDILPISDPGVIKAPDPGSWDQKGTGSRIRIRNTFFIFVFVLSLADTGEIS